MNGKNRKQSKYVLFIAGGMLTVLICISVFATKLFLSEDGPKRRKKIQMVTVVTPPPPRAPEKLPEPEIQPEVKQEEEFIETEPLQDLAQDSADDQASDDPAAGDELGLDAEGGSGSDSFGLKAKKGGRSIIGSKSGGDGDGSIMRKYAWYTRIIQEDLRKMLNKYLEQYGGSPDGDIKTIVQIKLDESGKILDYSVADSSGNEAVDKAVMESLKIAKISEPPPEGMPRTLRLRISARG